MLGFLKRRAFTNPVISDRIFFYTSAATFTPNSVLLGRGIVLVRLTPAGRRYVLHMLKGFPHAGYKTAHFQIL